MRLLTTEKLREILDDTGTYPSLDEIEVITKAINNFMSAPGIYQMPESDLTRRERDVKP